MKVSDCIHPDNHNVESEAIHLMATGHDRKVINKKRYLKKAGDVSRAERSLTNFLSSAGIT